MRAALEILSGIFPLHLYVEASPRRINTDTHCYRKGFLGCTKWSICLEWDKLLTFLRWLRIIALWYCFFKLFTIVFPSMGSVWVQYQVWTVPNYYWCGGKNVLQGNGNVLLSLLALSSSFRQKSISACIKINLERKYAINTFINILDSRAALRRFDRSHFTSKLVEMSLFHCGICYQEGLSCWVPGHKMGLRTIRLQMTFQGPSFCPFYWIWACPRYQIWCIWICCLRLIGSWALLPLEIYSWTKQAVSYFRNRNKRILIFL